VEFQRIGHVASASKFVDEGEAALNGGLEEHARVFETYSSGNS
jgi:hypothetical protein